MAINQNHLFEELNGVKCGIVEKNASTGRVAFLKNILEYNRYTVIIAASPAPKVIPPKPAPAGTPIAEVTTASPIAIPLPPPAPETFTIGVTDVGFNPINAIYGRLLKAPGGHIVTLAYWQQKESTPQDDIPYFSTKK